ncbi:GSCFA domain-containing protein [Vibrio metschnikovii]|uniref:GSCFA domain-containing protein n=1 Tax=Vibrio metschnikovii TaxID=28172 RepID=UPI0013029138|nr:GSCFA domain-containing protein [Vibrio metschnikovii]EKO3621458.1 GSCFA domain-containing protein [Vibrio metschnikovii]EKO3625590.1 GSCFA domain-containing protein [Vibrio metschnikovii]
MNPYFKIPKYAKWSKVISNKSARDVDPLVNVLFTINENDKIVTAGSCFAQHIAKYLKRKGYNYFISEKPHPLLNEKMILEDNYNVFSARYGNIYVARQLNQLFDRAFGYFKPVENYWFDKKKNAYVDPFRPTISSSGYSSIHECVVDTENHLKHVRNLFENLDVFVFTFGLTESWISMVDGAVFPLCPGVSGGEFSEEKYIFHNMSSKEIKIDFLEFARKLRRINPKSKIILTVSPVPLAATMSSEHILTANSLSKAKLVVAAREISEEIENTIYFPSYEIITGSFNKGSYFEDNLRDVTSIGVEHVMSCFEKNICSNQTIHNINENNINDVDMAYYHNMSKCADIICEEAILDSFNEDENLYFNEKKLIESDLKKFLIKHVPKLFEDKEGFSDGDRGREWAWRWGYWGRALSSLYWKTKDVELLELMKWVHDTLIMKRDHNLNLIDDIRHRKMKTWGTVLIGKYDKGLRSCEVETTGLILLPFTDFLIRDKDFSLPSQLRSDFLETIVEALDSHLGEEFVQHEISNGGYFISQWFDSIEPLNHSHLFGAAAAEAYYLTKKSRFKEVACKLYNYFRYNWYDESNGTVSWSYKPSPEDKNHGPNYIRFGESNYRVMLGAELFYKASVTIELPAAMIRAGIMDNYEDIKLIASSLNSNVFISEDVINYYISPRKIHYSNDDPQLGKGPVLREHYICGLMLLGQYDNQLYKKLIRLIEGDVKTFPKGWYTGPAGVMALGIGL